MHGGNRSSSSLQAAALLLVVGGGALALADRTMMPPPTQFDAEREDARSNAADAAIVASATAAEPLATATTRSQPVASLPPPPAPVAARIRVFGDADRIGGVPIAIGWHSDPVEHTALTATLYTDATGSAPCSIDASAAGGLPRWIDFAFPTNGLAASVWREDQEMPMPMVLQSFLDLEVVEADGRRLGEAATAEVRAVTARAPGDRWHRCSLASGCARLPIEFGGLELAVRVRTASGREAMTRVRGPEAPEEALPCRIRVAGERAVVVQLLLPNGEPAAAHGIDVRFAHSGQPLGHDASTDANGRLHVHVAMRERTGREPISLILHAAGSHTFANGEAVVPLTASLVIPPQFALAGGDLGAVLLAPAPPLIAGLVEDAAGVPLRDQRITVEVGRGAAAKAGSNELAWSALATTITAPDGTFRIWRSLPSTTPSRVRVGNGAPIAFAAGTTDMRMTWMPPRRRFGQRRSAQHDLVPNQAR
jgi:hypothetical protein